MSAEAAPAPRRAVSNGLWNAASNAMIAVAGVVASVVVVRSLTATDYGTMSYYLWLSSVTAALGTLALPHALTKVSAELLGQSRPAEADALTLLVVRVTLGLNLIITALFLLSWASGSGGGSHSPYLLVLAAVQLPAALSAVASSHLWARQEYRPVSLWTGLLALLQILLIGASYFFHWGGPGFAAATLGSGALLVITLLPHLKLSAQGQRTRVGPDLRGQYVAFLIPATLIRLIEVVVWQRSELFFLSKMSSKAEIGYYSLAYTLYGIVLAVGWALVNGYYPAISNLQGAGETAGIQREVNQGVRLGTLYAAPVAFAGVTLIGAAVDLLYGAKMQPTVPVGQVLLLGLIPGVICGMMTLTLSALGKVWHSVWLGLAVSVINIALVLWLIPQPALGSRGLGGALGAAVATTGAQFAYFVMLVVVLSRVCHLRLSWGVPALLTALAAVTMLGLPRLSAVLFPHWPIWASLGLGTLLGGASYLGVIWRTRLGLPEGKVEG